MSYCLIKNIMVAYVHNEQLKCAKVKLKLSGPDSTELYNFHHRVQLDVCGRIILEQESDRDCLPTLTYRNIAQVAEGHGGVLKRIEQLAEKYNITCRAVNLFKDASGPIAFAFFTQQQRTVACQILETDKQELEGKTLLIGADSDVDYAGNNVVPIVYTDNYGVDDKLLGNNMYSLHDDQYKMLVTIGK